MKDPAADLATLVIAVVIAALCRVEDAVGLVAAYALAWVAVNAWRLSGWALPRVPKRWIALGVVLVLAVPLRDVGTRLHALAENEALASPLVHWADRRALEVDPAIAPGLVPGDRPLTYFVRSSGARVRLRLGDELAWIDAESMGHGVFRATYDPRTHGALGVGVHATTAAIDVDGHVHARPMRAARPFAHPRWPRPSTDGARACIPSEETDEVIVVAPPREPERIATLDGPTDCAIEGERIFVSHRWASEVLVLDAARERTTLDVGASGGAAMVIVDGAPLVALAEPEGTRLSWRGQTLRLAGEPRLLVAGDDVFLATASPATVVRVGTRQGRLTPLGVLALAAPAAHLAVSHDRARVSIATTDGIGAPGLGNHFVLDRVLTVEAATLALVDDRPTAFRTERQDHAGDVDRGASPMGLGPTSRGTTWVAFAGTDEVEELGGPSPRVLDVAPFGLSAPHGVVELADGSLVVTSPSSGLVVVLAPDASPVQRIELAPADAELLRRDPEALRVRYGERAFYEATRSGVSCQSCHLHGGTDGSTHNIGGRLAAPTLDVRGILGTSPYLRDGSYPRIRDLHEVALTEYRGYRESAGDRGATIEGWIESLPPPPSFVPRDAARERAGLDVFVRAGCPECHAAPAFTSLGLHAIESVFPDAPVRSEGRLLDVPSLRSVAVSAPYLYDGRALTLRALITDESPRDRHGRTSDLDADDVDALVTFLRSL